MTKRTLFALAATLLFPAFTQAQTPYTVYPVPQRQVVGSTVATYETTHYEVIIEDGIDQATRNRLKQVLEEGGFDTTNFEDRIVTTPTDGPCHIYIGVAGSNGAADQMATTLGLERSVFSQANKYDRHIVHFGNAADGAVLLVLGENTDAAFYGLATVEQVLEQATAPAKTAVTFYDCADQANRGIVEGYYGYPYSAAVKEDLMRFMMRYKMNTYLYGAKSDPYHSNYWQQPYPTSITAEQEKNGWLTQDMVRDITSLSAATKVNFIWAIHPGNDFINSSSVISDIMGKYTSMYELGVRQFGVFVDDVGIPADEAQYKTNADRLTELQQAIEAKWNGPDAAATDTVRPLHFVPQVYCTNFESDATKRQKFFAALGETPSYITIYTTGYGVWSVPNNSDLSLTKNELGRSVAWWWNYPCNDNADGQIYPMDMYSNFYDLPSVDSNATLPSQLNNAMGIVCNPMQEGEVSKIPIFSVADYAWNNKGFNNQTSWEQSFHAILPDNAEAREAYKFLAPYLRYNDPEALQQLIEAYKGGGSAEELIALMQQIETNCSTLETLENGPYELLYNDLAPWLLKLHAMATSTRELLLSAEDESLDDSRWNTYVERMKTVETLQTAEEFKVYSLEGMGANVPTAVRISQPSERYLINFIDYLKKNALKGYFSHSEMTSSHTVFTNVEGVKANVTGTTSVYMTQSSACTLKHGQYLGIQLARPTLVSRITVADTLLANHSVVMSADGKSWQRITESPVTPEGYIRFVGVVNDGEAPVSLRMLANSIRISVPAQLKATSATLPSGDVWNGHNSSYLIDGDLTTFTCLNRNQQNGDTYTLRLNRKDKVKNVLLAVGTVNDDYMHTAQLQVSADGNTWKSLKVKGTDVTDFTMTLPEVKTYSDEVKTCLFDGEDQEALYVRLFIKSANTSKWLRLYEIQVNPDGSNDLPRCVDGYGITLPEVYDADPSTNSSTAMGGQFTYNFYELQNLKEVVLYCDPSTTAQTALEVTSDGNEWQTLGSLASGVAHVDLAAHPKASAIRLTWQGTDVPAIYEIVEVPDTENKPVVTEISQTPTASQSAPAVSLQGNTLSLHAAQGIKSVTIYSPDGRTLLSRATGGIQQAQITMPHHESLSALIVSLTLTDGTMHTAKLTH